MKRDKFIDAGISYDIFWNPDIKSETIGLYLYGFPGSIGANNLTNLMLDSGLKVIQPHYPGTYDSARLFSPEESYTFMKKLDETINTGTVYSTKKDKNINFKGKLKFAIGHSFGCFSLLRSAQYFKDIETIILFGPAITYTSNSKNNTYTGLIEDPEKHINYVTRSKPFTYRMGDKKLFYKLYDGHYDKLDLSLNRKLKNIIGIVGTDDPYFNNEILNKEFYKFLKSSTSNNVNIKLITIEGANHSVQTLLTDEVTNIINNAMNEICTNDE